MTRQRYDLRIIFINGLLCSTVTAGAQAYNYPNGSTVADFTVTDIEGHVHNLYDLTAQGKYVFLDFFTLWCAPCQETAPLWAELYQSYGCNGANVVCISLDYENNTAAEIQAYSDTYCGSWAHPPVVTDALSLSDVFGVGTAPTYCLIGPNNVMINNFIWTVSSLSDLVAALPTQSGVVPQSCSTGISERTMPYPLMFPNPTSGSLHTNRPDALRARVIDATGHLTEQQLLGDRLVLRGQALGLYVIELFNAEGTSLGRASVMLE